MDKQHLHIVKIGGNIIDDQQQLSKFLADFALLPSPKILVHGGGKKATAVAADMGLQANMHNGRRITDSAQLEVVTMVYAGLLNKKIVAQLQAFDCNALGLSGADANCIQAHKRVVENIDYGFAGDIDFVNAHAIHAFLQACFTPVFCAITHDKQQQLLNTNADTIASALAAAMSAMYTVELSYVFELKGVLENPKDPDSVIRQITLESYHKLVADKVISAGMIPKLHNGFDALKKGVKTVKIGNASQLKSPTACGTNLQL